MLNQQSNEKNFFNTFFSWHPYQNKSEGLAVFGASLLGAVIVPVAITILEPLIVLGLIASLLVSFFSSLSYIYHDLNDKQYLEKHADYYKNLHRVTTGMVLLVVVPPLCWSVAMIGVAMYRGLATLSTDGAHIQAHDDELDPNGNFNRH